MEIAADAAGGDCGGFVSSKKWSGNGGKSAVFRAPERFWVGLIGYWWLRFVPRHLRMVGCAAEDAGCREGENERREKARVWRTERSKNIRAPFWFP